MIKQLIIFALATLPFFSCTREYQCADRQLSPAFVGFSFQEIDTLILKKYKAAEGFQTLIDTFRVRHGYEALYQTSGDTTVVFLTDGKNGIKAGFDWQVFLPGANRTVSITEITTEYKTGKCGYGIFSTNKSGCTCVNPVYAAKSNNTIVSFSNAPGGKHYIPVRK